jgi:hypothetical protein
MSVRRCWPYAMHPQIICNNYVFSDMGRMLLLCQNIILERLNFLTDFKHRDQIEIVINQSGSVEELKEAGKFVKNLFNQFVG